MPDMEPFREALDEKAVEPDCPFCGETTWASAQDLTRVFLVPEGGDNGSSTMRGFEAFTIACNNCGFLRMHNAEILMRE